MSTALPPVCLIAGGLGTRLGALTASTPKALMDVNGEPFLNHQLRELARQGISSVVICVGHFGEIVEETIGHSSFGLTIAYSYDGPELAGTLGAIRGARNLLDDRFFILYGDTILTVDYQDAYTAWTNSGAPAFMSVLKNDGRWGESNAVVEDDRVTLYDKFNPSDQMSWIDYGLSGLNQDLLDRCAGESDLAALWSVLSLGGELAAWKVDERFYEIGTPEALEETRAYLAARDPHRTTTTEERR